MTEDVGGSVTLLFQRVRQADGHAESAFFGRYWPRLVRLAEKTLKGRRLGGAEAEDAAQTAMDSFFRYVKTHDFAQLLHRNELWSLLATFTKRKAVKLVRRESAQRRGGGAVLQEADLQHSNGEPINLADLATVSTSDLDVCCEEFLEKLREDLRPFALQRLLGYSNEEIANAQGCVTKTVQRKLELIGKYWLQYATE